MPYWRLVRWFIKAATALGDVCFVRSTRGQNCARMATMATPEMAANASAALGRSTVTIAWPATASQVCVGSYVSCAMCLPSCVCFS
jgi:hypothetical protein